MRLLAGLCVALLVGWFMAVPPSFGQGSGPGEEGDGGTASRRFPERVAIGADLMTRYVARGVAYSRGPVIKPWMKVNHLSYLVELRGVYDVEQEKLNEIDFTFDYARDVWWWHVSLGYNLYAFPNTDLSEMHEGYVNIVLQTFLKPAAKLYYGRWSGEDSFLMKLTVGHTIEFERCALALSAITVYRHDQSFRGTEFRMSVPIPIEGFTLRPTIRYSWSVKDEIADTLYGGLTLQVAF